MEIIKETLKSNIKANKIAKTIRSIISPLVVRRSRLDLDEIPQYNQDNPQKYSFSGKRISRGQYRSSSSIIINAVLWVYVSIACVLHLMGPVNKYGAEFAWILLVLSLALCVRIITNAYYLDLSKEKKNSKELVDEGME